MEVEAIKGLAKDGELASHVVDREKKGAEYGDNGGFTEGNCLDVCCGQDWEHGAWEVRGDLACSSDEIDEGLSGLTVGGGSHHSIKWCESYTRGGNVDDDGKHTRCDGVENV